MALTSLMLFGVLWLSQLGQQSEPAAMLLTTKGASLVERRSGFTRPLAPMTLLLPGDELRTNDPGEALLFFFADGHRERVKPGVRVRVDTKGCTPAEAVTQVTGPKLSPQDLAGLHELSRSARIGALVVRSIHTSETLPRIAPLAGAVVLDERPPLAWSAKDGVDGYLVEMLTDPDEGPPRRLWQVRTKDARLGYPADQAALEPGAWYLWRVYPVRGDKAGELYVESRFSVATRARRAALDSLKALVNSGSYEDLLLAAALYEAHGVYDEALRLYEGLGRTHPQESIILLKLANLYEMAGRADEARVARQRARKGRAGP